MAENVQAVEPEWLDGGGGSSRIHAPGWSAFMMLIHAGFGAWLAMLALGVARTLTAMFLARLQEKAKPRAKKRRRAPPRIWESLRAWSRTLLLERSEAARFWPLLRCILSLAVCVLYVFETYWMTIGLADYIFRCLVGLAFLFRHLGRFVMSDAPTTFVITLENFVECLSITSLILARGRLWLNFSFLQAYIALCRLAVLEKDGSLLAKNATIARLTLRLALQAIVFVYIVGSGLQMFELLGEAAFLRSTGQFDFSWINAFYFVVITITTVGYGDFVPYTLLGRLCTILVIVSGVFLVSSGVNEAIEVVSRLHRGMGVFSKPTGTDHVVVTGNIKWTYLTNFVTEFYAEQKNAETKVVVLCERPAWSDDDWNNFISSHGYMKSLVVELHGSARELKDLRRCQLENASGVFVLCNPHDSDPYKEDSETLQNILAIRNFNPSVPIYSICSLQDSLFQVSFASQEANNDEDAEGAEDMRILAGLDEHNLHISPSIDHMVNSEASKDWPRKSRAICMQNVEIALFADNIFCNGLSTLISNLVFRAIPRTNRNDRPWLTEYKFGAEYHMERAEIPPGWSGKKFSEISLMLYDCQLLLVAIHSSTQRKWKVIRSETVFGVGMEGIFITLLEENDLAFALSDISTRLEPRSRESSRHFRSGVSSPGRVAPLPDALFGDGDGLQFYEDSDNHSSHHDSGSDWSDDCHADHHQPRSKKTNDGQAPVLNAALSVEEDPDESIRYGPPGPPKSAVGSQDAPSAQEVEPELLTEKPPLFELPVAFTSSPQDPEAAVDRQGQSASGEQAAESVEIRVAEDSPGPILPSEIRRPEKRRALTEDRLEFRPGFLNSKKIGTDVPTGSQKDWGEASWSPSGKLDIDRLADVPLLSTSKIKKSATMAQMGNSRSKRNGDQPAKKSGPLSKQSNVDIIYRTKELPVHLNRHVIVCIIGEMSLRNLEILLRRIWNKRTGHTVRCPVVAIHPDFPESYNESFAKYRGLLFLVNGSSTSIETLHKAQFGNALAIMVMACEDKLDIEAADSRAIFTVMTLDHLLAENATTFVCCTLDAEESLELLRAPARPRRQNVQLGGGFHPVAIMRGDDTAFAKPKKPERAYPVIARKRPTVRGHTWQDVLLARKISGEVDDDTFLSRQRFVGTRGGQLDSLSGLKALASRSREEIFERQRFASGEMMISSLYTALLIRDFVDPGILDLIQKMTGMRLGKKNQKKGGSWIRLLAIPATLMRTDMIDDTTELTYRTVVEELLAIDCVPLGLYRSGSCPVRMQIDVSDEQQESPSKPTRSSLVSSGGMRTRTASFTALSAVNSSTSLAAPLRPRPGPSVPHHRRRGSGLGSLASSAHHDRHHSGASMVLDSKFRDLLRAEGKLTEREYYCPTTSLVVKFEETSTGENVLPYVFTNPEPYTLVSEVDGVFVVCDPQKTLPAEWTGSGSGSTVHPY